jgi:hypothetical protein
VRQVSFVLGGQLELGTVLDPALSCLDFVIDFQWVSIEGKKVQFFKARKVKKRKASGRGHALGTTLTTGAQETLPVNGVCAPRPVISPHQRCHRLRLETRGSPSGYNAVVTLWK